MVVLDTAIVNVALPSMQRALHFTPTGLEWVVNGYALAFGGLLLLGGRAGDLFGRRRVFVTGVLLFTLGSLGGGLATSSAWLIIARVAQGVGGAIVAPTALSLVADTFPEGTRRNRTLGVYAAVSTTIVAVSGVGPNESGLASALLNVGQQLGGSMGLAVLGTVAATVTKNQLANSPLTGVAVNHAVTVGYSTAFGIATVIALAGFVIAVATIRGHPQRTTIDVMPDAA